MRTDADRWNHMARQIRTQLWFNLAAAVPSGAYLTGALLRPKDPFYIVSAATWTFLLLFSCYKTVTFLSEMSQIIALEEIDKMKSGANRLAAYLLGGVFSSLCLGVSLLWSRAHGRLYLIASLFLGILVIPFVLAIKREINRLPGTFPPRFPY